MKPKKNASKGKRGGKTRTSFTKQRPGPGRPPGVPNEVTREWKETLAAGVKDEGRVKAMWTRYDREMAARPGTPAPIVSLVWQKTFANPPQSHEITGAFDVVSHLTEAHRTQHAELSRLMAERAEAGKRAALEASATANALLTTTAPEEKTEGDES